MYPRSSPSFPFDPAFAHPPAVNHAHAARKLLQRAVRHLKHVENAEYDWHPADDSRLIQQAMERLAVADLLIDAYTTPLSVRGRRDDAMDRDLTAVDEGGLLG
jgi:hypothetical protein